MIAVSAGDGFRGAVEQLGESPPEGVAFSCGAVLTVGSRETPLAEMVE